MGETDWTSWMGRFEDLADDADPKPIRALNALLDKPGETEIGDPVPDLSHWLYFLPMVPMSKIGPDGHPMRGGFLPPLPIERRMWAGGRLTFHDGLKIGDHLEKRSEILKISEKEGKTGRMAFVTIRHQIRSERGLAIDEEQDIVYLEMPKAFVPPDPIKLPDDIIWRASHLVDRVALFRFSAITFNGHRIHYDLDYANRVEKYPGLVVHGPFQAMLLLTAAKARNPGKGVARFSFRGTRPLFDFDDISLCGRSRTDGGLDLYTANGDGNVCMQATVGWKD